MGLADFFIPALAAGTGYLSAQSQADANVQSGREANAANLATAKLGVGATQAQGIFGSNQLVDQGDPGKGFVQTVDPRLQPSVGAAIDTANIRTGTGKLGAEFGRRALEDFTPSVGSLDEARGIIRDEDASTLKERRVFNEGISAINRRVGGAGFNAPAFGAQSGKFLNEFVESLNRGGERRAIELFQNTGDENKLLNQFKVAASAGTGGLEVPAVGAAPSNATAGQILGNVRSQPIETTSGLGTDALSGFFANIYQQQQNEASQQRFIDALRGINT